MLHEVACIESVAIMVGGDSWGGDPEHVPVNSNLVALTGPISEPSPVASQGEDGPGHRSQLEAGLVATGSQSMLAAQCEEDGQRTKKAVLPDMGRKRNVGPARGRVCSSKAAFLSTITKNVSQPLIKKPRPPTKGAWQGNTARSPEK